jgi:Saxitoxin biosynthesis operon protein SxtJ
MTKNPNREQRLEAMLVIATGLLVLHLVFKWPALLYAAVIVGLVGVFSDLLSRQVTWLWFKLAEGLGWVNSRILLAVVFFGVLLPVALLARLFGKNAMRHQREPGASYFTERNHRYTADDLRHPW